MLFAEIRNREKCLSVQFSALKHTQKTSTNKTKNMKNASRRQYLIIQQAWIFEKQWLTKCMESAEYVFEFVWYG